MLTRSLLRLVVRTLALGALALLSSQFSLKTARAECDNRCQTTRDSQGHCVSAVCTSGAGKKGNECVVVGCACEFGADCII
jgi:hypothetical protein